MDFEVVKMRFIVALSLVAAAVVHSQKTTEFRLPTNFKPISYRLDVTTHLEDKFVFEGVVDIKVSSLYSYYYDTGHGQENQI